MSGPHCCREWPCPVCHGRRSYGYLVFDCRIRFGQEAPRIYCEHEAPTPNSTTGVQLAGASGLIGVCAKAVKGKSSGTSKRKAPLPDTETGIQLADASDLKGEFARAVKHKSLGTGKTKAPSPGTITGVQLADAKDGKGVYARPVKDKLTGTVIGYKYEPRFTPPREEVEDGTTRRFDRLSLGEHYTRGEAKIMLQIARFYYGKDHGCVELDGGQFKFFIPPMNEQERGLAGEEKRKWVTKKSKQVYADLGIQKRNFEQLSVGKWTGARSSHDKGFGVSEIPAVSSANALEYPSCPATLPPCDVADALEVPSSPAPLPLCGVVDDRCETFSGLSDMDVDLPCPDSPNSFPQQSSLNCEMRFLGFGQIHGGPSSPQADGVTQFIQSSVDAPLSPRVDFHQGWDLVGASGSSFIPEPRDPVLPCPDSPNSLPQLSSPNYDMRFLGFGQILGGPSSPQADGAAQGIQDSDAAQLSPRVDFQQGWDLVGASGSSFFPEPRDPVLPCPDSSNSLPQQSSLNFDMRFLGFGQILGGPSSPQAEGAAQGIQDSDDSPLSRRVDFQQGWNLVGASTSNFFPEPRVPVLQQLVHRQKQQLEVYALQVIDLKHRLWESQVRNSEQEQEIERLRCQFTDDCLI